MKRLHLIGLVWIFVAMVAPELRPLLLVGAFCWFGGAWFGTQHRAKHDAELRYNRLMRNASPLDV